MQSNIGNLLSNSHKEAIDSCCFVIDPNCFSWFFVAANFLIASSFRDTFEHCVHRKVFLLVSETFLTFAGFSSLNDVRPILMLGNFALKDP